MKNKQHTDFEIPKGEKAHKVEVNRERARFRARSRKKKSGSGTPTHPITHKFLDHFCPANRYQLACLR